MLDLLGNFNELKNMTMKKLIAVLAALLMILYLVRLFHKETFAQFHNTLAYFSMKTDFENWSPAIEVIHQVVGFSTLLSGVSLLLSHLIKHRVWLAAVTTAPRLSEERNKVIQKTAGLCVDFSFTYLLMCGYCDILEIQLYFYAAYSVVSGIVVFLTLMWGITFLFTKKDTDWY